MELNNSDTDDRVQYTQRRRLNIQQMKNKVSIYPTIAAIIDRNRLVVYTIAFYGRLYTAERRHRSTFLKCKWPPFFLSIQTFDWWITLVGCINVVNNNCCVITFALFDKCIFIISKRSQTHEENTCRIILYTLWLKMKLHTCIIPCNTTHVWHVDKISTKYTNIIMDTFIILLF